MKKVALVVGHNARNQGAAAARLLTVGADSASSEYTWAGVACVETLNALRSLGFQAKVFRRRYTPSGYASELKKCYAEVDQWGADASIEFHFNAYNRKTAGSETLASTTPQSLRLASFVQAGIGATYGREGRLDRGVKTKRRQDRGGGSLYSGKAPACLIEPFFGDNEEEIKMVNQHGVVNLAYAIALAVRDWAEQAPRKNLVVESRTIRAAGVGVAVAAPSAALEVMHKLPAPGSTLENALTTLNTTQQVASHIGGLSTILGLAPWIVILAVCGFVIYERWRRNKQGII